VLQAARSWQPALEHTQPGSVLIELEAPQQVTRWSIKLC
jgi:hypothetical protein